jgi:hypothetical protein
VNAKWVTDRGSQVYNVKAYGATGNGSTDDTAAIGATITAAGVGGTVLFPPGNYVVSSQILQGNAASHQTVWGYGATIVCNLSSAANCWAINGTNASPMGISIYGLHLAAGSNMSQNSAIQDNGSKTHLIDVGGACQFTGSGCYTFGHFVENDDDQSMMIDHLFDMDLQRSPVSSPGAIYPIITCTASYCGSALWGPGGSGNAGITYLSNSDLSMACGGNPIDWNGNHLTVSNTILQAWSQFAMRTAWTADVNGWTHWEQGSCTNPLNDGNGHSLGGAGLIVRAANVTVEGAAPGGPSNPSTVFATSATGGGTTYWYYVVGHTASGGVTAPLIAGWLQNGPSTVGSSASIYAIWPALTNSSVTTWDVLRTPGTVPYGTGNYAVATGLAASTYCTASSGQVCAFTDTVASPSSYALASETWYPSDTFWPGNMVLFAFTSGNSPYAVATYNGPAVGLGVVNSAPSDTNPHVSYLPSQLVEYLGENGPFGPSTTYQPNGMAIAQGQTSSASVMYNIENAAKGVINFGSYYNPTDFLTTFDSNPAKTRAHLLNRPSQDANDSAVCTDGPAQIGPTFPGLCLRSPAWLTNYIGTVGDNASWLERLTGGVKTFRVPLNGFSVPQISAPTISYVRDAGDGQGTLSANTQYCYKVTAVDSQGETTPSSELCVTTANDGVNTHGVNVLILSQSTSGGYKVYGRTTGAEQLITSSVFTNSYPGYYTTFLDTGSVTPSGSPPSSNTTGNITPHGITLNGVNKTAWTVSHGLSFSLFNAAGLTTSQVAYLTVPFACTIAGYSLNIDQGTITVKFWKVATGTAVPTSSNSISTNGESIASGTAIDSTTLSDFTTTSVSAYDHMAMAITAVSSATQVNAVLACGGTQ